MAGRTAAVTLATRLAWKRYILIKRSWKMLFASSTALGQGQFGGWRERQEAYQKKTSSDSTLYA
jgi:hypothetical protein